MTLDGWICSQIHYKHQISTRKTEQNNQINNVVISILIHFNFDQGDCYQYENGNVDLMPTGMVSLAQLWLDIV